MERLEQSKIDLLTVQTGNGMSVSIYENRDLMGKAAAADVAKRLQNLLEKQETVNIVFAAAPSQNEFLQHLSQTKNIDWHRVNAFHMDEYIGLEEESPQRFGNYLNKHIFDLLPFKSTFYINGSTGNAESEALRYEKLLKQRPVDIVLMGIGENGHIAFNDPPAADFDDPLWVKKVKLDLACRTQQVNDKCFDRLEDVPLYALTLTVPALLSGKYLYCIVPSKRKAQAVCQSLTGPIKESCPASILRTHPQVKMYLDKESSSLLDLQTERKYVAQ